MYIPPKALTLSAKHTNPSPIPPVCDLEPYTYPYNDDDDNDDGDDDNNDNNDGKDYNDDNNDDDDNDDGKDNDPYRQSAILSPTHTHNMIN
jgi:hypothetical protein